MINAPSSGTKNKVNNTVLPFKMIGDCLQDFDISLAKWHPSLNSIITFVDKITKTMHVVDTNMHEYYLHSIDVSEVKFNLILLII
jgi:hypothetical protein